MNAKVEEAFNRQLNAEMYSSYLYLSMSAYFESINLAGLANWMRVQAQEELLHAMKFFSFICERGGKVTLDAVNAPPSEWKSPLAVFENTCEHEAKVTGLINGLLDITMGEKDHASTAFLQWFVTEQVEEEASADKIRQQLKLTGDQGAGLFMIDRELAQRTFIMPAATSA